MNPVTFTIKTIFITSTNSWLLVNIFKLESAQDIYEVRRWAMNILNKKYWFDKISAKIKNKISIIDDIYNNISCVKNFLIYALIYFTDKFISWINLILLSSQHNKGIRS